MKWKYLFSKRKQYTLKPVKENMKGMSRLQHPSRHHQVTR